MPKITKLVNRAIMMLTMSDVFSWGVYTVLNGLAGLYLVNKLGANTVQYVGLGTAICLFTRAVTQIPFGILNDRHRGDKDEILFLVLGCTLMGVPFLVYPFVGSLYVYLFLQFIFGLGTALNLVSWRKLFARNVDKDKEGQQYGVYDSIFSLTTAFFSAVVGVIANISQAYFDLSMVVMGLLIMAGGIWGIMLLFDKERKP